MSGLSSFLCAYCGNPATTAKGAFNRAKKVGAPLYCDKKCAGLGRRGPEKASEQRKSEKAAYDAEYRTKNRAMLKAKKARWHQETYDPEKARAYRQTIMPRHIEYCRRPEYVAWKKQYDRTHRAIKRYGDFAECFLLVMDIRSECLSQMTDYEIRYAKGGVAKTQQRRRDYDRANREDAEVCPVGNLERGQGWQDGGFSS